MSNLKVVFTPHPPIIIPEIGKGEESNAQSTIEGMQKIGQLVAQMQPATIIFITPHGSTFRDGTCILQGDSLEGDFAGFGYPDIAFKKKVNQKLSKNIHEAFKKNDFISILMDDVLAKNYKVAATLDHGVMVPMYYIEQNYTDYEIVLISPGFTSLEENYNLGRKIQEVIENEEQSVLVVCSGDLSHALKDGGAYQFHPSGPIFDQKIQEAIENKDPMILLSMQNQFIEQAAQCGLRPFLMGFGIVDGFSYQSEVFSYEGPFGVGYLTGHLTQEQELKDVNDFIKLARKSIEVYTVHNRRLNFEEVAGDFTKEFIQKAKAQRAGSFVSIHNNGELRGCVGTISATRENLIDEIIDNSISASGHDPRFNAVQAEELEDLEIKVDILMEAEKIESIHQLDVRKYGVIVEKNHKKGLLLPNLEGVTTVEQQVEIAMNKAGITKQEGVQLYRFEVIRHEGKNKKSGRKL